MTESQYLVAIAANLSLGGQRIKLLYDYFGSAKRIWNLEQEELTKVNLRPHLIRSFTKYRESFDFSSYFKQLEKRKIGYVTYKERGFPKNLKGRLDCPVVIYYKGSLDCLRKTSVALVGSREASWYGKKVADMFASELAKAGITIVSGLAKGIDTASHKAALWVKGKTVGVLGCGLDRVYPYQNYSLAEEIIKKGGAIISEYPLGTPPLPENFRDRNRIISGLCNGVLVIEGRARSGTLITASHAAQQGVPVFAVPGDIFSDHSAASFFLIKSGAKMVSETADILEELKITASKKGKT